jgi:uncharacterized protein (DUF1330 family)
MTALAAVLLAVFAAIFFWQVPGAAGRKLGSVEVARYLEKIERSAPMLGEERTAFLARVKAWAEADDGQPVYMLNLMRYHEKLRAFPDAPAFAGTPREANDIYEKVALRLLLKYGGYALYAGGTQSANVLGFGPGRDDWSRVLLVRYPSRRAFLELVTDPAYGPIAPYKFMALDIVLTPTTSELVLPNLWVAAGALLLMVFLATGWFRAARRVAPSPVPPSPHRSKP